MLVLAREMPHQWSLPHGPPAGHIIEVKLPGVQKSQGPLAGLARPERAEPTLHDLVPAREVVLQNAFAVDPFDLAHKAVRAAELDAIPRYAGRGCVVELLELDDSLVESALVEVREPIPKHLTEEEIQEEPRGGTVPEEHPRRIQGLEVREITHHDVAAFPDSPQGLRKRHAAEALLRRKLVRVRSEQPLVATVPQMLLEREPTVPCLPDPQAEASLSGRVVGCVERVRAVGQKVFGLHDDLAVPVVGAITMPNIEGPRIEPGLMRRKGHNHSDARTRDTLGAGNGIRCRDCSPLRAPKSSRGLLEHRVHLSAPHGFAASQMCDVTHTEGVVGELFIGSASLLLRLEKELICTPRFPKHSELSHTFQRCGLRKPPILAPTH
mmetsp:Transcript_96334/g.272418  ORF Transcript_96334/g.272418 Transcript_96334/m.272418 type:complete len:381 (+) Transcript_96334:344-1486(+)